MAVVATVLVVCGVLAVVLVARRERKARVSGGASGGSPKDGMTKVDQV